MSIKGVIAFIFFWSLASVKEAKGEEFTNMWIAEIHGGEDVAQRVARELGYTYKGQADMFENHYVFIRDDHPEMSPRGSHQLTRALQDIEEVKWAQQQYTIERSTQKNVPKYEQDMIKDDEDTSKVGTFSTKPSAGDGTLATYEGVTKNIQLLSTKPSAYSKQFNDPLWTKQWYSQDYRTKAYPVMDHNIVPVYKMGFTGKGVFVAIVDDGLEKDHPDLEANYNYSLSWDASHDKEGSDPDPPGPHGPYSHGTRCAGMVGMVANNKKCGVGVAHEATLAGIKVLGPRSTYYVESKGLVRSLSNIDIYSCSWNPVGDGIAMYPMDHLTDLALQKGITQGRNGKGAIYTFAAGNGRYDKDNCATDAFVNHIATIPVAAAGQDGKWSWYTERCTAVFTTAYSGTHVWMEETVATDLEGACTINFSGTSSATPLISGIIALTLQANPNLTYRDVMHLITMSSEVAPLADNGDIWYKNGKGFWVSNDFGFGLLNAENMVNLAKTWKNVPEKKKCSFTIMLYERKSFTVSEAADMSFEGDACKGTEDDVTYLEQVEVASTVEYPYRGAISITLTSPAGTKSAIFESRPKDNTTEGINAWSVKSVHNWGEDPRGTWYINVAAVSVPDIADGDGLVKQFDITFHGTSRRPSHYKNLPRKYAAFRLSNGKTSED